MVIRQLVSRGRKIEFHEHANLLPLISDKELDALAADIQMNGQQQPIHIFDGKILDGRNRFKACQRAGVEPWIKNYTGENPLQFVLSANLHRRHLNESQRAMVAANIANLDKGQRADRIDASIEASTQNEAAKLLNVDRSSVQRAKKVQEKAADEIADLVSGGDLAVSQAAAIANRPKDEQKKIAEKISAGTKPIQATKEVDRENLPEKTKALPSDQYRIIYADPPWKYGDDRSTLGGYTSTAAENNYPTMPIDEICDLPVKRLAAPDSVLFMWATFPLLPEAIQVINAWGFKYKTAFVWDKQRSNVGNYHSASAELLIVSTQGKCTPEIDKLPQQVVSHPSGKHSAKPEAFRHMIDSMYKTGPRIELFRRGEKVGRWQVWGNEAIA